MAAVGGRDRLQELTERAARNLNRGARDVSSAGSRAEPEAGFEGAQPLVGSGAKPQLSISSPSPSLGEGGGQSGGRAAGGQGATSLILGIDPGTATMGYGLVRVHSDGVYTPIDYGVFETPPDKPMPHRLRALYDELTGLLQRHRPTHAVVERLFFGRNVTTALTVGQARGVALLAIAQVGLDVAEYTPAEIKYALSSYGKATKSDIQRMTQMLLRLPAIPKPDDAADALAVALCHAHSLRARALGIR